VWGRSCSFESFPRLLICHPFGSPFSKSCSEKYIRLI
jgi:hypothetical protein